MNNCNPFNNKKAQEDKFKAGCVRRFLLLPLTRRYMIAVETEMETEADESSDENTFHYQDLRVLIKAYQLLENH